MIDKNIDRLLVERFQKGDRSAFEEIICRHQDRIYNICRYMLINPSDAQDAAQEVFIKLYENLSGFSPSPYFSSWLYRIAFNTCIDHKRRPVHEYLNRASPDGDDFALDESSAPWPDKSLESKELNSAIFKAIAGLSEKLKTVILLKDIEGLSYEEIAEALDISMGTVKSRISRAREELKKALKDLREQY
ncbi:MAG: sigma-70 family RNA polymerase sigma factor [Deltaproteobacteria bacterium]|nr:sigma-70 family RNA polymerase sigma factor [Deltaproteobacteria bacterium]